MAGTVILRVESQDASSAKRSEMVLPSFSSNPERTLVL